MSKLLLASVLVLLLVLTSIAAFGYSSATLLTLPMVDLFSLDHQNLWALVYNERRQEYLFRSTDGGTLWTAVSAPFPLYKVFFVNPTDGWGIASEGSEPSFFCVFTSDSGRTWKRLATLTQRTEVPTAIAFDTSNHGWVVGQGEAGMAFVLETNDGGEHWSRLPWKTEPSSSPIGVRIENGRAFTWSAGAGGSGVYELQSSRVPKCITDRETMNFAFLSEHVLIRASLAAVYLRVGEDAEWKKVIEATDLANFWDLRFVDSATGCVAGGEIYCTDDGGQTWSPRPQPGQRTKDEGAMIYSLYLINRSRGLAVSDGAIYQTDDGAHTWHQISFFDRQGRPVDHPLALAGGST